MILGQSSLLDFVVVEEYRLASLYHIYGIPYIYGGLYFAAILLFLKV